MDRAVATSALRHCAPLALFPQEVGHERHAFDETELFSTATMEGWSESLLIVGDDVDRSLLGAGRGAVDPHVSGNEVLFDVRPNALVGVDQPACSLASDLPVVDDLLVWGRVRVGIGNLVLEAARPASRALPRGSAGVTLGWRVALIEHVVRRDRPEIGWLDLVELFGLVGNLVPGSRSAVAQPA